MKNSKLTLTEVLFVWKIDESQYKFYMKYFWNNKSTIFLQIVIYFFSALAVSGSVDNKVED